MGLFDKETKKVISKEEIRKEAEPVKGAKKLRRKAKKFYELAKKEGKEKEMKIALEIRKRAAEIISRYSDNPKEKREANKEIKNLIGELEELDL